MDRRSANRCEGLQAAECGVAEEPSHHDSWSLAVARRLANHGAAPSATHPSQSVVSGERVTEGRRWPWFTCTLDEEGEGEVCWVLKR